ncbi:cupin domain-containing protein [Nocardia sp. NPDC004722]
MTYTHAARPAHTSPENQIRLPFLGAPETVLVGAEHTGGEFALLRSGGPHGHSSPWHRHLWATETFIVEEGDVLLRVGDEEFLAAAGHAVVLPRGIPHGFVVVSDSARYLTLHTPAGFESFVADVSAAGTPGSPPDPAMLRELAARHGIEILGPGIGAPAQS